MGTFLRWIRRLIGRNNQIAVDIPGMDPEDEAALMAALADPRRDRR